MAALKCISFGFVFQVFTFSCHKATLLWFTWFKSNASSSSCFVNAELVTICCRPKKNVENWTSTNCIIADHMLTFWQGTCLSSWGMHGFLNATNSDKHFSLTFENNFKPNEKGCRLFLNKNTQAQARTKNRTKKKDESEKSCLHFCFVANE